MSGESDMTTELRRQVTLLEVDLRVRVESQPVVLTSWRTEYEAARKRERTASTWATWRDERVTQAAVAWVLITVFVRFCEDNQLVRPVWISGPKHRRQEALDAQREFFRSHPMGTDREWIAEAIDHLASIPATRRLVDDRSPLHSVSPSGDGASALLTFWRERDDDGRLSRDLSDNTLSTRFLGDVYQDISESAKKTFALLQTPEFVEEFILTHTLEDGIGDQSLEDFRAIDPACGSGHFIVGLFSRILDRWSRRAPGLEARVLVQRTLDSISGVDINPFAVAITIFRLTVAALKACGETLLEQAPAFIYNIAVGDSLIHGMPQGSLDLSSRHEGSWVSDFGYRTENLAVLRAILKDGTYNLVVGNPPYIAPSDARARENYRALYSTCKGRYSLVVPFIERSFALARPGGQVGLIVGNSFMTRTFGEDVIERFLRFKEVRLVVDTKNLNIAGHGTPTAIIIATNTARQAETIQTVVCKHSNKGITTSHSPVWNSLVEKSIPGFHGADQYAAAAYVAASELWTHPLVLMTADERDLMRRLNRSRVTLRTIAGSPGLSFVTGEEEAYKRPSSWTRTRGWLKSDLRELADGEQVRDWRAEPSEMSLLFPYTSDGQPLVREPIRRELWPLKRLLEATLYFGKNKQERGLQWESYAFLSAVRATGRRLAYPLISDQAHFVIDVPHLLLDHSVPVAAIADGGQLSNRLLCLNSSITWFWMKRIFFAKGDDDPEKDFHEIDAKKAAKIPLPEQDPSGAWLRELADLSQRGARLNMHYEREPSVFALDEERREWDDFMGRAIALQEELDWECYRLFGITNESCNYDAVDVPSLSLGQRAFELEPNLADLDGNTLDENPQLPRTWPAQYKQVVLNRVQQIRASPQLKMLESPAHKRRWSSQMTAKRQEYWIRSWLLDRLEEDAFWFDSQGRPTPRSLAQLADDVARVPELVEVLGLWEGRPDLTLTASLTRLLADEAVPFLAAYRYKASGYRKRSDWETTWHLQREQDGGEYAGSIAVPPRYAAVDFAKVSYWKIRGRLDIPKERFISYPNSGRDTDPTPVIGWSGWDHAQQALALNLLIGQREQDGWDDELLVPLIAGLAELQPWIDQWHGDIDPSYGFSLAAFCREELTKRAQQVGRTLEQLAEWRPPKAPTRRGRRPKTAGARS